MFHYADFTKKLCNFCQKKKRVTNFQKDGKGGFRQPCKECIHLFKRTKTNLKKSSVPTKKESKHPVLITGVRTGMMILKKDKYVSLLDEILAKHQKFMVLTVSPLKPSTLQIFSEPILSFKGKTGEILQKALTTSPPSNAV